MEKWEFLMLILDVAVKAFCTQGVDATIKNARNVPVLFLEINSFSINKINGNISKKFITGIGDIRVKTELIIGKRYKLVNKLIENNRSRLYSAGCFKTLSRAKNKIGIRPNIDIAITFS